MASPRTRGVPYSRKAQYGLFFGYVAAVTGMIVAALLLALSVLDPRGFGALSAGMSDLTVSLSASGRGVVREGSDAADAVGAYLNAASRNRALEAEVAATRDRLVAAAATEAENRQLRALLGLVQTQREPVATARMVASTATSVRRFATIDRGADDGVLPGQPVVTAAGLVGRVEAVARSSARVQLVTDAGNVIPIRRAADGLAGIATGTGDGGVDVRPLVSGANPFRRGDLIVTSGVGGVFTPGTPVGIVARVTGDGALLRPRADPAAADFVAVYPVYLPPLAPPPPPAG